MSQYVASITILQYMYLSTVSHFNVPYTTKSLSSLYLACLHLYWSTVVAVRVYMYLLYLLCLYEIEIRADVRDWFIIMVK